MVWDKSKKGSNVPKKALEDIFRPSEDLEIDDGLKIGIYSRSKMGKTHLGASAAEFATRGPVYIIDTENNVKKETKRLPLEMQQRIFVSEVLKLDDDDKDKRIVLTTGFSTGFSSSEEQNEFYGPCTSETLSDSESCAN